MKKLYLIIGILLLSGLVLAQSSDTLYRHSNTQSIDTLTYFWINGSSQKISDGICIGSTYRKSNNAIIEDSINAQSSNTNQGGYTFTFKYNLYNPDIYRIFIECSKGSENGNAEGLINIIDSKNNTIQKNVILNGYDMTESISLVEKIIKLPITLLNIISTSITGIINLLTKLWNFYWFIMFTISSLTYGAIIVIFVLIELYIISISFRTKKRFQGIINYITNNVKFLLFLFNLLITTIIFILRTINFILDILIKAVIIFITYVVPLGLAILAGLAGLIGL